MVYGYLGRFGLDIAILSGEPGALEERPGAAALNPSYLALGSGGEVLYATERTDESLAGQVSAYAMETAGLRALGSQPTGGRMPCHLSIDPSGTYLLTANYGTGSLAVHPIRPDGSLGERSDLVQHNGGGPNPDRQAGPHAHMIVPTPDGAHVLAVDLGTDTVYRYELTAGRLLAAGAVSTPPGAGPRHLAFHPDGQYAYVANELDSTVSILDLATFQIGPTLSTLPDGDDAASYPSAIRVTDDGRYCYVANRGPDTVAVFEILLGGAELRLTTDVPCGGVHPRDLVLAGDHMYVANQHSDVVTSFRINPRSGAPEPTGHPLPTRAPACVLFVE